MNRNSENSSNEIDVQSGIESWVTDEWHHIAATWSNTGKFVRLYIDGSLVSDRNFTGNLPVINQVANNRFQLGADGIRFPLEAIVDEVRISDNARTSQEIATRMISGITVVSAALVDIATTFPQPAPTSIELYPGWNYWKDLRFNATTSVGTLKLPLLLASWSTSNAHIAEMDVVTGRIKAKDAASDSAPATGLASITTAFGGSVISIATNVRSAAKPSDPEPIGSELAIPATNYINKIPVAIVRYLPAANDTILDSAVAGSNTALATMKANLYSIEKNLKFMMEHGSRFRAYNTPASVPSLGYEVVKIINIYEPIPNGIKGLTLGTYYPDYKQILARIKAADLVNTQNVKEFWIESYSYPSNVFEKPLVEDANMSSQLTGDVTNNPRRNDDLPIYDKSYTIYGIDLAKPFNFAARAHASQLEALLTYANKNYDSDTNMFARSFVGFDETGALPNNTHNYGRVGKATRPPNTAIELKFDNAIGQSDIKDWNAIDPPQVTFLIDSSEWSGIDYGWNGTPPDSVTKAETNWYIYWMQSMPGFNNFVFHENTNLMNNWWRIIADWDGAKSSKLGLYTPATCNYTLGASAQTVPVAGASGSVTVAATTGCSWTVTKDPAFSWITINSTVNNTGNGTVNFTVAANPGSPRTATLNIAGLTHTITQEGNNLVPKLSSITPSAVIAGSTSFTLTLNGTDFVPTSVVQVNSVNRATTFVNSTKLTIEITAAEIASAGTLNNVIVINPAPGGGSSLETKTLFINNPSPALSSIEPATVLVGGSNFTLTLNGTGFVAASVAQVNGTSRVTTLVNSTPPTLTIVITAAEIATAGEINIVVINPAPVGGSSATKKLSVNNPIPTLTNLSQTSAFVGSTDITLLLTGANFNSTSKVRWNGADRATSLISATQLSATIPASDLLNTGTASVTVFNSSPIGGTSAAITFAINNPAPTLSSIAPNSIEAGNGLFTLTVNGTGFLASSIVRWNGNNRTTTFGSSTQLSANITAADVATGGSASVTVFNPTPGGGTSLPLTFSITSPCNYSISPTTQNFTSAGGGGSVTITTTAGCAWMATSNDNWITINAGSGGSTGNGTVSFTVATNTGASRSGTMTVAGQPFTVTQDALQSTCASQRTFSSDYFVGQALQVSLQVSPPANTQSYAVEEVPPPGWTVTAIDSGGQFDAVNGKVKWGPFFDATVRTLKYSVTPPAGTIGQKTFSGIVSINGLNNTICGTTTVNAATLIHPADLNNNLRIEINELTAYGSAWKAGTSWSRSPNPIDINYVTNAGLIWKLGEVYHYDAFQTPPFAAGASISMFQPSGTDLSSANLSSLLAQALPLKMLRALGYMPGLGFGTGTAIESLFTANPATLAGGTAVASFNAANYTPGVGITVIVSITPDANTHVYAVEDTIPTGWTVSGISNNGAFDSNNRKVKWGPYFDNGVRTLSYIVTPPAGETGSKTFIGSVSFDGLSVIVTGARTLSPPLACTYSLGAANQSFAANGGTGNFTVTAPTGCSWNAATSDAWITLTQGSGSGNGTVNFSVSANAGAARSGTIVVGGQTFTINQGLGCSYALSPGSQNFTAGVGTGTIAVIAGTGCPWTAVPSAAWITITTGASGTGNGVVSFSIAASDGSARTGSIGIAGQIFAVTQAANTAPTITAATGISAIQNTAANTLTIATVTDAETPAATLVVTALTIPAGITLGTITNTNGIISASVSASCLASVGSNSITLKVIDGQGTATTTNLLITVINNLDCNPQTVDTSAGDHKTGSILIYNYYTSDVSAPGSKNTQVKLTNTSDTEEVTIRMALIDGQTGNISIVFFCLSANQTINFLASEYDPSVTGYIIAVAVDKTTGCPVKSNVLMGGAYIKLPTGHSANLPAIAVSAIATTPATCNTGSTTATLAFDGLMYSRLPHLLAIDNLTSIKDGNMPMLVLNRIGGNLNGNAPSIGTISGKIYNTGRASEEVNFTASTPQSANTLSVNFPRIGPKKLDVFIPSGQSGWIKLGADSNIGLTGVLFNFNAARSQYAYSGGNNLQAVSLAGAVTLDLPLAVPVCR